jgi:hypothetical protein
MYIRMPEHEDRKIQPGHMPNLHDQEAFGEFS